MNPIPVSLAVEDRLSEAVLRRLLDHANCRYFVSSVFCRGGYGYLKRTANGWNLAAASQPFVLLTDLDTSHPCPSALIAAWLDRPLHPNMLFRVAVREVESWVLADCRNLAVHLRVAEKAIPREPDRLDDPKAALVEAARRSRQWDVRARVVPKPGSTATVGPEYNDCLIEFVSSAWDVDAAATASPSLARALARFRSFEPFWPRA